MEESLKALALAGGMFLAISVLEKNVTAEEIAEKDHPLRLEILGAKDNLKLEIATSSDKMGIQYGGGFGFSFNNGHEDYLVFVELSKDFGKKVTFTPYLMAEGSMKFLRKDETDIPQENISYGLRAKQNLTNKISLGVDLRKVGYSEKKLEDGVRLGVFVSY